MSTHWLSGDRRPFPFLQPVALEQVPVQRHPQALPQQGRAWRRPPPDSRIRGAFTLVSVASGPTRREPSPALRNRASDCSSSRLSGNGTNFTPSGNDPSVGLGATRIATIVSVTNFTQRCGPHFRKRPARAVIRLQTVMRLPAPSDAQWRRPKAPSQV